MNKDPSAHSAIKPQPPKRAFDNNPVLLPVALALGGFLYLQIWPSTAHLLLLGIGTLIGCTLRLANISFTSCFRALFLYKDLRGINAQILMLAIASLLFAPMLSQGSFNGQPLTGAYAPVGGSVVFGAFIFGIGMQLAGGCGSGTLYSLGAGGLRMALVLIAFCAGSFTGSLHMVWWQAFNFASPIVIGKELGWSGGVLFQLLLLATIWGALRLWTQNRSASNASPLPPCRRSLMPLTVGALLLAFLNLATLVSTGHPWTITWAFGLWGAKIAMFLGWSPESSAFWSAPFQANALQNSVFSDTTSVMNFGIVFGAFLASILLVGFHNAAAWPHRSFATLIKLLLVSLLGGLLLGYGARIAYGCNIGAFFSGVASTSLHGWVWIVAALPGNWVGLKLRAWLRFNDETQT